MEGAPPISVYRSAEAAPLGEAIYGLLDRAFRGPPHPYSLPRKGFLENWSRYLAREGFLLFLLGRTDRPDLRGFLYGYRAGSESWWYDRVAHATSPEAQDRWLSDSFETVGMGIDPLYRGRRYGSVLLRRALETVPHRAMVLSTYRDRNPAVRFYRREGFEVLHPGMAPAPGEAPMQIMGRAADRRPPERRDEG